MDHVKLQLRFGLLGALFAGLFVYGSLVPFDFQSVPWQTAVTRFVELPWFPQTVAKTDFAANVVVMFPISFFVFASLWTRAKSVIGKALAILAVLVGCGLLSVGVEFSQIWFSRNTSKSDMVAQAIGAAVGVLLGSVLVDPLTEWIKRWRAATASGDKLQRLLEAYMVGFVFYNLMPLDLTIDVEELGRKLLQGRISLLPLQTVHPSWNWAAAALREFLLYLPVGLFVATWRPPDARPVRSIGVAVVAGCGIALTVEVCHVFIASRTASVDDVLLGGLGVLVAAAGARAWNRGALPTQGRPFWTHPACWFALAAVYAMALVAVFWYPYDFTDDRDTIRDAVEQLANWPLAQLQRRSFRAAVVHSAGRMLMFLPLGYMAGQMLLSTSIERRHRWLGCFVLAPVFLGVAAAVELGQLLLPTRTPDATDIFFGVCGAIGGVLLAYALGDVRGADPSKAAVPARSVTWVPGLDGLRAFACLAVFAVHFQQLTGVSGRIGPLELDRLMLNGNHGVALFFLLSGYLLSWPFWQATGQHRFDSVLRRYPQRRAARILPAYWLCLAGLFVLTGSWQSSRNWWDVTLHAAFVHNLYDDTFYSMSAPFWTIAVQVQFYVVFAAMLWLLRRLKVFGNTTLVVIFFTSGLVAWLAHAAVVTWSENAGEATWWLAEPQGPAISRSLLAHFPIFLLGSLTAAVATRLTEHRRRWAYDVLCFAAALALVSILGTSWDDALDLPLTRYHFPWVPLLLSVLILAVPLSRLSGPLLAMPVLRGLGVISYGFYVYHLPCLKAARRGLEQVDVTSPILLAITGLAFAVVVSTVSYLGIERPLLRWVGSRRAARHVPLAGERDKSREKK